MKKFLLSLSLFIFSFAAVSAQTTVLDFEDAATSTTFSYFGSDASDSMTVIVPNPDMSGINTSATVSDFYKPAGSEVWAGAYSNPNPMTPIDLVSHSEICIKVWAPAVGNLALKIENGDRPNWIITKDITEANTWVELCYDTKEASIEDPFEPAFGGVYSTMVLFFDFGTSLTDDQVYYFDDVVLKGQGAAPVDVTFNVDLSDKSGFTTAYVSGGFNNWSLDNPMTDMDGDGIYTATVEGIPAGGHEYKFQLDNSDWEQFTGTETCTVTDPSGQFVNRRFVATEDATLPTVCFNSCYACGEGVKITINMGQGSVVPDSTGFFIAGGGNFGVPGDNALNDDDGDGIWSITFEREKGFESFYIFTNGFANSWDDKEDIAGQPCANPDNFNDRKMGPLDSDIEINTCFGLCSTTTDCGSASGGDVTFKVNMAGYTDPFDVVYISGNFNSWDGGANPMTDADGDGIWETTVSFFTGNHEYKFQVDQWTAQEEFMGGESCTVTAGNFVNREVAVAGDMEVCFDWNTCDACAGVNVNDLVTDNSIFTVQPSIVQSSTQLIFGEQFTGEKSVSVFNALGQIVSTATLPAFAGNYTLEAAQLENGLYFVNVRTEGKQQTQRIIVNK